MTDVRHLRAEDLPDATEVLTRAFSTDEVFTWVFPDEAKRPGQVRIWMEMAARLSHQRGHAYVTDPPGGVTAWSPPDVEFFDDATLGLIGTLIGAADPARAEITLTSLAEVGAHHPEEAHFYLHAIGVDPDAQGQGLGSVLLGQMTAVCDAQGLPAYLESSSARNRTLYERHGFEVTAELEMPMDGPTVRPMWREPRR